MSLRQLRGRIVKAAGLAGIEFALDADTATRSAPSQRACWFEGGDQASETTEQFVATETDNPLRTPQDAVELGKRRVRYFISYAHADKTLKDALMEKLGGWFGSAKNYTFEAWHDVEILPGQDWHVEIQAAIQACDFGLLLVSADFLARPYITGQELHHFVAPDPHAQKPRKLAVPVALRSLRFEIELVLRNIYAGCWP